MGEPPDPASNRLLIGALLLVLDVEHPGLAERLLAVLDNREAADLPENVVWLRPPQEPPPHQLRAMAWLERTARLIREGREPGS